MIVDEEVYLLEHAGVKGMKWGVRKAARQEVRSVQKTARGLVKQSRKAKTSAERRQISNRYKKEVLDKVRTKEFKDAYQKANTMGKGELAAYAITTGPIGVMTVRAAQREARTYGQGRNEADIRAVLKEMRS